uniref:Uncharacterized protein n=1 Tax=Moniliophthora roreri TaxID=221103 RepID=A0A0W0FRB1_MONRR
MSFTNSSSYIRGRNTLNHIHGNQVNGTINAGIVNFTAGQETTQRTVYDEFPYVKRGDMFIIKEIYSVDLSGWDWNWRNGQLIGRHKSARRSIYVVEILPYRQAKFTAVMYEGDDVQNAWEADFRQFSHARKPGSTQLFGINRSEIPALIFHSELIPLAHLYKESFWMNVYVEHLAISKECGRKYLWMDTKGVLCSGPQGPPADWGRYFDAVSDSAFTVPSTVDMLEDDVSFRFFCNIGSSVDKSILECAWWSWKRTFLDTLFQVTTDPEGPRCKDGGNYHCISKLPYLRRLWRTAPHQIPMDIIEGLRFDTVYSPSLGTVAKWPRGAQITWKWRDTIGLQDKSLLDDGITRFKLAATQGEQMLLTAWLDPGSLFWKGWLSQSLHISDTLEMMGNEQDFFVVDPPQVYLTASRYASKDPVAKSPAIYLFVYPFPMSLSELVTWVNGRSHFWSVDQSGQSKMSKDECEQWGLPTFTPFIHETYLLSWPSQVYAALRDWQTARSFDPKTSDWARHMGYPELEIIGARNDEERFVFVDEVDDGWEYYDRNYGFANPMASQWQLLTPNTLEDAIDLSV